MTYIQAIRNAKQQLNKDSTGIYNVYVRIDGTHGVTREHTDWRIVAVIK